LDVHFPTGTVVFLFSDIEGSTRRWERYGDAMRDALRRHDEILRSEIEAHRGYVFKTIGDEFCAAFATIREALAAAVGVQRRMARENFGHIEGLAVRMALHAGETDERGGDYFGPAVNRTARLLSAGHGGQILLSRVAADLSVRDLPDGITLRHLGTLPLRDIDEPESVYQPVGAELRTEFKALRALKTPPNNLPRQTTSFVGRNDDLLRVEALLHGGAVVTIAGAGGIGKTRLALEVAASLLADQRDGAWFVDLSAIANASAVPDAMVSTLGAPNSPDRAPADSLLAYLEKRELLLILDNSEHLVSAVADIAAQIAARCPHVTLLVTSREPLDISCERIYRLETLDPRAAAQLFADRARAADPAFRPECNAAAIVEICERVDGIALAVELAAARVRAMPVAELAAHLQLRLLAGGRDRRPRQQTMHALVEWSYDLLSDGDRRVLRRCSVFVRGFTLAIAREVCGDGTGELEMLEALASLVDKSLIVADARAARYRLLEPIREYAAQKLAEAGELHETMLRHAAAFAAVAGAAYDEYDTDPAADWLERMEHDLANFRVALHWSVEEENDRALGARIAAGTSPIFVRLALLAEGIDWCERVLTPASALPATVEAPLHYGLSMLYGNQGVVKKVLVEALAAAELFRRTGDERGLSRALSQAATRFASEGRHDESRAAALEALALARASGDPRLLADTLRRCATAFANDGVERVRALFAESVELFGPLGRDEETARALEWWGQWEAEAGNYPAAAERLLEARSLARSDLATMYYANNLASFYLAIGDLARAQPFAREAVALAAKARHPILVPAAIAYIAIAERERDVRRAARLFAYAETALRAADWELVDYERALFERLRAALVAALPGPELSRLLEEGAAWTDDRAVAAALWS
jgi:predicted ATPase/class 3 adenylate cyclase